MSKLTDSQVIDLLERIGQMLIDQHGERFRAETTYGQTAIDAAIKILFIAEATMIIGVEEDDEEHLREAVRRGSSPLI